MIRYKNKNKNKNDDDDGTKENSKQLSSIDSKLLFKKQVINLIIFLKLEIQRNNISVFNFWKKSR